MIDAAHLDSLYKAARIVLWVEDTLTRDYLRAAWGNSPDVAFFIAGGGEHIPRLVTAARQLPTPIGHVFGVIDRDFELSNRSSWATADNFRLPRHELENYFLDKDAMAAIQPFNNRNRDAAGIEGEMMRLAGLQTAWLACRSTISQIRNEALSGFIESPRIAGIPDAAAAINHIVTWPWFAQTVLTLTHSLTTAEVTNRVNIALAGYSADLTSDSWLMNFSGKEIFRPLRSFIYQPSQKPGEPDNDMAKAIGSWQAANSRIPQDIADLLVTLRQRVGLPP